MADSLKIDNLAPKPEGMPIVKTRFPYHYTKDTLHDDSSKHLDCDKRLKKWIYLLLERPQTKTAFCYHFVSLLLIFVSLVLGVLSTIQSLENKMKFTIFAYEIFLLMWFSMEFLLRTWSCGYCSKFQGFRGRVRFILSFYMLIDVFVILSTAVTLLMQVNGSYFTILRVTRFMQVFRILRVDRQRGDFRTMGKVVKEHSKELITVYFVGFVIMFASTYIVYLCEKQNEIFFDGDSTSQGTCNSTGGDEIMINNMANGLYWAVITVTSVGYGDLSPVTWTGKIFCAVFALVGCAFFSLPAGILGSGFALQVAKQKKEKRFYKVRNPAAYLIQTIWRNYAIRKSNTRLQASWFYLLPQLKASAQELKTLETLMKREMDKSFIPMRSLFTPMIGSESHDFSKSINNKVPATHLNNGGIQLSPNNAIEGIKKLGKLFQPVVRRNSDADLGRLATPIIRKEHLLLPSCRSCKEFNRRASTKEKSKMIAEQLQEKYKIALRFIMRLRYWNAIKSFKNVRHPFVNMQDIMEKNAISHIEILSQIKSMKESFQVLHDEVCELRKELAGECDYGATVKTPNHNKYANEENATLINENGKQYLQLRRSFSLGNLNKQ